MVKQDRYHGVDRYLPHAIVATATAVLIPLTLVVILLFALDGELAPLLAAVLGAALSLIVAGIGSVAWSRSRGALDIAFSELLIWGWIKRKRAEETAARNARLLGLDDHGRPANHARSARAQQLAILGDLSSALESKDPYTHGHSQRVERHAMRIAHQLDLSVEEISELRRAAELHDVGKIRVPHRILRKPGSLTPEERRIIEQHSVVGAWLVSNVCRPSVVAAVRHHHERWDGRGYPDQLSRDRIPLYARIIAVADAFDAMTSTRPYRVAYDSKTAAEILEAEAGAQFDPNVVRAFVSTMPVRVPIAAFLPFAGAGLWRKALGGLRRALSGTALTGAAAAGTAAVMIASVITPVETPMAQPDRPQAAAPADSVSAPTVVLAGEGDKDAARVRQKVEKVKSRRAEARGGSQRAARGTEEVVSSERIDRASRTDGDAGTSRARKDDTELNDDGEGPSNRDGSGKPDGSRDRDDPGDPVDPGDGSNGDGVGDGNDGDGDGEPTSKPSKPPKASKSPTGSKGDPQPDHGNDCPAKPGSPGSAKHCAA